MIEALADLDQTFLERFVSYPRHGRTRRYLARDKNELYPGRPDLANEYSYEVRPGFWLGTNTGRWQIEKIIRTASDVAGLNFGSDIIIDLGREASAVGGTPNHITTATIATSPTRRRTRSGDPPVALMEVLEVADEVLHKGQTYREATLVVTKRRQLRSEHTVPNACTRLIGLNTREFKALLADPPRLITHLVRRFPSHEATIRDWLQR